MIGDGVTVVDCVPSEMTENGRDSWLTMACVAIFFDSLNLGTYKAADEANNLKSRTLQEVRRGYEGAREEGVERLARERGKIGAVWVFMVISCMGYEETWKAGAVKRGANPDANDPWYDLLLLDWAPVRYRYSVRFVLHFACGVFLEQQSLSRRGIVDPINQKHLKERLALDIEDFMGAEARNTLEKMMADSARRMREQPTIHSFFSMLYPNEGWISKHTGGTGAKLPWFTGAFNARIECLLNEKVSN